MKINAKFNIIKIWLTFDLKCDIYNSWRMIYMETTVFSQRIKELRTNGKMTQRQFAAKVSISAATLSAYENNEKSPSLATAERIAKEYNVSLDWLCGFDVNYNEEKTCGDMARMLCMLINADVINVGISIKTSEDNERISPVYYYDNVEYAEVGLSRTANSEYGIPQTWLDAFLINQKKMYDLLNVGTISLDIYQTWLETTLEKLDEQKLKGRRWHGATQTKP